MLQQDDDGLHGDQGRDGETCGDHDALPGVWPLSSAHVIPQTISGGQHALSFALARGGVSWRVQLHRVSCFCRATGLPSEAAKAPARQPAILSNVTGIVPPVSTVPPKKIVRPVERYEDAARTRDEINQVKQAFQPKSTR